MKFIIVEKIRKLHFIKVCKQTRARYRNNNKNVPKTAHVFLRSNIDIEANRNKGTNSTRTISCMGTKERVRVGKENELARESIRARVRDVQETDSIQKHENENKRILVVETKVLGHGDWAVFKETEGEETHGVQ